MLNIIFLQILDMTKIASIVIGVVLIARLLLKRAPKVISYALWGVVLFRLLCPVAIEAPVSMVPQLASVSDFYMLPAEPTDQAALDVVNDKLEIQNSSVGNQEVHLDTTYDFSLLWEIVLLFGKYVWVAGIVLLLGYNILSYGRLKRKLVGAVILKENIYLADYITFPFVTGVLCPKIYLPSTLSEKEREYIILHEQHHIKRLDPFIKLLSFFALCIHWFNPLVWIAFIFSSKDMEMSCDEAVVKKIGIRIRADYSASLLTFATGKRVINCSLLAFGEGDTKERIKNLANWKKPAFWVIVVTICACIVLAVCLLTNRVMPNNDVISQNATLEEAITDAILNRDNSSDLDGLIQVESHRILATESGMLADSDKIDTIIVYALVLHEKYFPYVYSDGLRSESGSHIPTALTFSVNEEGMYTLLEYWIPRDGSYYKGDIEEKFPEGAAKAAFNTQDYIDEQTLECQKKALEQIQMLGDYKDAVTRSDENKKIILQRDSLDFEGDGIATDSLTVEQSLEGEKYSLITVKLDSGLSTSIKYPFRSSLKDFITVQTDKLHYTDRDSIIIEITDETSNYGSTDIHVLHVINENNEVRLIEDLTILDNMEESLDYEVYKDTTFILPMCLVTITEKDELISYMEAIQKNALKVTVFDSHTKENIASYIYWDGSKWRLFE